MTNKKIFDSEKEVSKWLGKLTIIEQETILKLLNIARAEGYNEGQVDAHSSFQDEVNYRGWH
jgi:hypothetical protein